MEVKIGGKFKLNLVLYLNELFIEELYESDYILINKLKCYILFNELPHEIKSKN